MVDEYTVVVSESLGMTFRYEDGDWYSWPTNIDGSCDFDDGMKTALVDWIETPREEVEALTEALNAAVWGAS